MALPNTTIYARIRALLGVEPGEERATGLLATLYFVLAASFVFVQTTAYGLFIQEFGARNLPFAYLSIAVFASLLEGARYLNACRVDWDRGQRLVLLDKMRATRRRIEQIDVEAAFQHVRKVTLGAGDVLIAREVYLRHWYWPYTFQQVREVIMQEHGRRAQG